MTKQEKPKKPKQNSTSGIVSRDRAIEQWAENEIARLIDTDTPKEERERRIHRLTEGPPEFVQLRADLPRNEQRG
jgi:hypothetical protein